MRGRVCSCAVSVGDGGHCSGRRFNREAFDCENVGDYIVGWRCNRDAVVVEAFLEWRDGGGDGTKMGMLRSRVELKENKIFLCKLGAYVLV